MNTITNSIGRDTRNTEQKTERDMATAIGLAMLSLEELQTLYADWLKRGYENFETLCLIGKVLGEPVKYAGGRTVNIFSFVYDASGKPKKATIRYSETRGTYLTHERGYSQTRSVAVYVDGHQAAYLRQTNDPNTPNATHFYIPGLWEESLAQYRFEAEAQQKRYRDISREMRRQELIALLSRGES